MTFQSDQTVYLPDGREAVYVASIGGQHAVRVVYDVPSDDYNEPPYSFPDDKMTMAAQVFARPPVERYDEVIAEKQKAVDALRKQAADLHAEMRDAERNKTAMVKAAAKYPDLADALDFIEGRITHVVQWSGYGGAVIVTIKDALEDRDNHYGRVTVNGMKLLCLFGTGKDGSRQWKVNQYRDGSGSSWATVWPARSEDEARAKLRAMVDEVLAAWRSGDEKWWHGQISLADTFKQNPWLTPPDDWAAYVAAQAAKNRADQIAKLRDQIEKLEGAA
jgi:hypothetical protein